MSEDQRPPMPEVSPEKKAVWVPEHTIPPNNTVIPAHWRVINRHKPAKSKVKPGPVPGKPRMTNPTHASHVYEQLDIPLALLLGLRTSQRVENDYLYIAMINRALKSIEDARVFINRFTGESEGDPQ